jgi:phosphotransferase family enzyme
MSAPSSGSQPDSSAAAERRARAVAAATAVVRAHGLDPADPVVLQDWNNTIVHLRPLPLVARVSTSPLAPLARSLERELAVASHLAARTAPVIPPSHLLPPGPHEHAGLLLTFWDYVEGRLATQDDAAAAGASLAEMHRAFSGFEGDLPSFRDQLAAVARLLEEARLSLAEADRAFLRELHARLTDELPACDERPLHGEAHLANAMVTQDGIRWFDFESACRGPLEWDLSALPDEAHGAFEYIDSQLLALLRRLRSLCVAVWCSVQPGRAPEVAEAAALHLRLQRELG